MSIVLCRHAGYDKWWIIGDSLRVLLVASLFGAWFLTQAIAKFPASPLAHVVSLCLYGWMMSAMVLIITSRWMLWDRMYTAGSEANQTGINILLYGTGLYLNAVGKKPSEYDRVHKAARDAVLRTLPQVQHADEELLTARSHRILSKSLQGGDRELALAVLDALPHIGTQAAITHVRTLANGQGKLGGDDGVREAANVCLVLLKKRIAEQDTRTLLRASQQRQSSEELLRPTRAAGTADTEHLLRAAQQEPTVD